VEEYDIISVDKRVMQYRELPTAEVAAQRATKELNFRDLLELIIFHHHVTKALRCTKNTRCEQM